MGKSQRDKGLRREREFARLVGGERIPLSGAAGGSFNGDVKAVMGGEDWLFELKARKDGWKEIYSWLEGVDAVGLRADRKEWLIVLPLGTFMRLVDPVRYGKALVARDVDLAEEAKVAEYEAQWEVDDGDEV